MAVSISLLLAWFAVIEPTYVEFEAAVHDNEATADQSLVELRRRLVNTVSSRPSIDLGPTFLAPRFEELRFMMNATDDERADYALVNEQIEASKASNAKLRQNAVFELMGAKFPVPKTLVVLSWCLVLLGLVAYISMRRQTLVRTLLKSKREFERVQDHTTPPPPHRARIADFAGEAPFWLAPVASLRATTHDVVEARIALGWNRSTELFSRLAVYAGMIILIMILVRVTWIGFMITDDYKPAADAAGYPVLFGGRFVPRASDIALSALFVGIVGLMLRWIIPLRLAPIYFMPGRRGTIQALGLWAVATGVSYLSWTDSARWRPALGPRRARKDPEPWGSVRYLAGFYRRQDTPATKLATLTYVTANRATWVPAMKAELVAVNFNTVALQGGMGLVRQRHRAAIIELAALDNLPGNRDRAILILRKAIDDDRAANAVPQIRFFRPAELPARIDPSQPPSIAWPKELFEEPPLDKLPTIATAPIIPTFETNRLSDLVVRYLWPERRPTRLYDLLALLLATQPNPNELEEFAATVGKSALETDPIQRRVRQWRDSTGSWHRRIANKAYPLVWKCPTPDGLLKVQLRSRLS